MVFKVCVIFQQKAGFLYVEEAFSKSEAKYRRRVVLAVSQGAVIPLKFSLGVMFRNTWTHLQAQLASGCLVMRSLAILLDLSLVKSKIIFSGSSGLVTSVQYCHHDFFVCYLVHICQQHRHHHRRYSSGTADSVEDHLHFRLCIYYVCELMTD